MVERSRVHIVVIGGGLAGLTTATYLARGGAAVTVLEQAHRPGGRAVSEVEAGFVFNRGIHALYCGGAAEQTLRDLAVPYVGHRASGFFTRDGDRLHPAPMGALGLLQTRLLSAADKWELVRVLAALPRLHAPALATTSVADWVAATCRRPRVRQFLTALCWAQMYTSALDIVSAEALIGKLQLALRHPILYLDGGWQTIVDGLRSAAEQSGAAIRCDSHVAAVEYHAGHVGGVRLRDGARIAADAVVIATSPQSAAKLAGSARLDAAVAALVPAYVACLDVALRRLPRPDRPIAHDLNQPCFMSAQSRFSRVAPAGQALVYSFKQLDPRQPADPERDQADLERLLDAAQPGWRDVLVQRRSLPRIAAFGALPLATTGGYAGRPQPAVPDRPGLFVAGDWVGPGFLADASFGSARAAAELALAQARSIRLADPAEAATLAA